MCGIVGFINSNTNLRLENLEHRGPDSKGVYCKGNVQLGHTRLSIQDVSMSSNQPFQSEDGRYVLVFNGEIYNHLELKNQLLNEGKSFRSTGDTETVLQSLIQWGNGALKKFNGIFALCFYDTLSGNIILARDRFGVKPLYIGHEKGSFVFSSELKGLTNWEHYRVEPDIIGLESYLRFLWTPGERTPLVNIKKLRPGEYVQLEVSIDRIIGFRVDQFYKTRNEKATNLCEEELVEALDIQLRLAVQRQLLSDVPIGYFLSGGLDSSLLVAIAKDILPDKKIQCFTIDTQEFSKTEGFQDDLFYAKKVANYLDVDLEVIQANDNILKDFDKMIWHLDEPQADAAPLNVYYISLRAKELGYKVLIGGTAGDDLFSGYRRHAAIKRIVHTRYIPSLFFIFLKKSVDVLLRRGTYKRRINKILSSLSLKGVNRIFGLFEWIPWSESSNLFIKKPDDKYQFDFFNSICGDLKLNEFSLKRVLNLEQKTFLVDHNLNYTDKMGMAAGVEIRVPYLDNELFEFAMSIPDDYKIKDGELKYILKKVAEKYLPKEVIYRSKSGFGGPIRKWISEDFREKIKMDLSENVIRDQGIFKFEEIEKLVQRNQRGEVDGAYTIWSLLAIQSWFKQFQKS